MKRWGLLNRLLNNRRARLAACKAMPRPKGFSLLEVLIALSIVSITLLGFAETELAALKMEQKSQQGYTLLELLLSLSIGMFIITLMLKLFVLQEKLHQDVNTLSMLNRHAITTQLIFTREIQSAKSIQILNNHHEIKVDNKLFYLAKNNLYVKKDQDVAVELMSNVKNLSVLHQHNQLAITAIVYLAENKDEKSGVRFNHSIDLRFFVKPHCTFNTGNLCE